MKKTSTPMEMMEPCPKCGMKNPKGAKFCNNCGLQFSVTKEKSKLYYEALSSLHLVAALYCLIYALNFGQTSLLLLILYVVPGVLGLYLFYAFKVGKIQKWTRLASECMVIVGLIGTFIMFLIAATSPVGPIIEPAWIIFVVILWELWKSRSMP
jgi:ribosomal protein L40E